MARRPPAQIPADLRARLETARLDLLALFRALDRMELSPAEIPQRLSANSLTWMPTMWKLSGALDQLPASLDLHAMLRDTNGRAGTINRGLRPFSQQSSAADPSHPKLSGNHRAQESRSC